jgi:DeoR family deoxyribose operon repressor
VDEKRRAARHAAKLLEPHQMAFFDCGTTTPWIIDAIDSACPLPASAIRSIPFFPYRKSPSAARFCAAASSTPATPFLNR